jgi:hypothetical protein
MEHIKFESKVLLSLYQEKSPPSNYHLVPNTKQYHGHHKFLHERESETVVTTGNKKACPTVT